MANIKCNSATCLINIKPYANVLFTSILITWYIMSSFQQKRLQDKLKGKKKTQSKETKESSEPDSEMT